MLIFAALMFQFYSASIVSSLLITPSVNIKDLKDLLESSLDAGVEDILYNRDYFNVSYVPFLRRCNILTNSNK